MDFLYAPGPSLGELYINTMAKFCPVSREYPDFPAVLESVVEIGNMFARLLIIRGGDWYNAVTRMVKTLEETVIRVQRTRKMAIDDLFLAECSRMGPAVGQEAAYALKIKESENNELALAATRVSEISETLIKKTFDEIPMGMGMENGRAIQSYARAIDEIRRLRRLASTIFKSRCV